MKLRITYNAPVILTFTLLAIVVALNLGKTFSKQSGQMNSTDRVYPIKEGFVGADDLFLYHTEIGDGEPLVVLHGGLGGLTTTSCLSCSRSRARTG